MIDAAEQEKSCVEVMIASTRNTRERLRSHVFLQRAQQSSTLLRVYTIDVLVSETTSMSPRPLARLILSAGKQAINAAKDSHRSLAVLTKASAAPAQNSFAK